MLCLVLDQRADVAARPAEQPLVTHPGHDHALTNTRGDVEAATLAHGGSPPRP